MLHNIAFLASSSLLSSGAIGQMFTKWEEAGFFDYLIPFLIIFALVFGILGKVDPFKGNKKVYAVIAVSVALMALRFDMVPAFFGQLFPRLGVGIAVILSIFIIAGLFIDTKNNAINYTLLGIGVLIFVMVLVQSTEAIGWQSGQWWGDNWQMVVGALFIFIIIAVIVGSSNKDKEVKTYAPIYAKE